MSNGTVGMIINAIVCMSWFLIYIESEPIIGWQSDLES